MSLDQKLLTKYNLKIYREGSCTIPWKEGENISMMTEGPGKKFRRTMFIRNEGKKTVIFLDPSVSEGINITCPWYLKPGDVGELRFEKHWQPGLIDTSTEFEFGLGIEELENPQHA